MFYPITENDKVINPRPSHYCESKQSSSICVIDERGVSYMFSVQYILMTVLSFFCSVQVMNIA